MRLLSGIWIFYRKLILPAAIVSILFGGSGSLVSGSFSLGSIGNASIFIAPLFHFLQYELSGKDEYYFYYNLGLSRASLWISTLILSSAVGIILMIL